METYMENKTRAYDPMGKDFQCAIVRYVDQLASIVQTQAKRLETLESIRTGVEPSAEQISALQYLSDTADSLRLMREALEKEFAPYFPE